MTDDIRTDPDFIEFEKHVKDHVLPAMKDSSAAVQIVPKDGDIDVKYAVELGMCILLDKPIIVIASPGVSVPPKMALVADEIVEVDWRTAATAEEAQKRILLALNRMGLLDNDIANG